MAKALLEELRKGPQSCSSPTKASGELCKANAHYLLPFSSEDGEDEDMETKSQEESQEDKINTMEGQRVDSDMDGCGREEDALPGQGTNVYALSR